MKAKQGWCDWYDTYSFHPSDVQVEHFQNFNGVRTKKSYECLVIVSVCSSMLCMYYFSFLPIGWSCCGIRVEWLWVSWMNVLIKSVGCTKELIGFSIQSCNFNTSFIQVLQTFPSVSSFQPTDQTTCEIVTTWHVLVCVYWESAQDL